VISVKKAIWMISIIFCVMVALLASGAPVSAEDATDEDQLFSTGDTVVSQEQINDDKVDDELKEKRIGFSGQINADLGYTNYSMANDWSLPIKDLNHVPRYDADQLANQLSADLFVDIRLTKGIKGFLSLGVDYFPGGVDVVNTINNLDNPLEPISFLTKNYLEINIKEFFVDTNWKNKVYFRTGKQFLKWGQGYFWSPTDFINVARKDFFNMNAVLAGTFGSKITIPSGVKQNVYFFVDMNNAKKFSDTALAGKYEFLVKNTEMSLSASVQKDRTPFYGFDISGRVWNLDYHGEIGLKDVANYTILDYNTLLPLSRSGELSPQVSLGFTKFFTVGDIKDKISLTTEVFYNQAGYDQNIIERITSEVNPDTKEAAQVLYLVNYQSFMNSKYYLALFGSVQKFMVPEMTLNINSMMNLVDKSVVLTAGISYVPALTDMAINFNINGFLGAPNTEATFSGNCFNMSLGTKISF
jgi:hypothetical protein